MSGPFKFAQIPKIIFVLSLIFYSVFQDPAFGQTDDPFRIFGYFQTSFQHQYGPDEAFTASSSFRVDRAENSFNVQQLNLFFQRDIGQKWRTFISFEALNSFSSFRDWGAFNIEEAWLKYRANAKFSLKIGLLVPTFNNFNEIKNRTPIIPYIIRPLAYEASFNEQIAVEDYVPARAFLQTYGFLGVDGIKFDYAFYLGNSPNVNSDQRLGQTGVDTTNTVLFGGRLGLRFADAKIGVSLTRDNESRLTTFFEGRPVGSLERVREIPRTRIGADFSYNKGGLQLEGEYIALKLGNQSEFDLERNFYYGTLGYRLTENMLAYASYWKIKDFLQINNQNEEALRFDVRTAGLAYHYNDRITFKAQFAVAKIKTEVRSANVTTNLRINFLSVAASVMF